MKGTRVGEGVGGTGVDVADLGEGLAATIRSNTAVLTGVVDDVRLELDPAAFGHGTTPASRRLDISNRRKTTIASTITAGDKCLGGVSRTTGSVFLWSGGRDCNWVSGGW